MKKLPARLFPFFIASAVLLFGTPSQVHSQDTAKPNFNAPTFDFTKIFGVKIVQDGGKDVLQVMAPKYQSGTEEYVGVEMVETTATRTKEIVGTDGQTQTVEEAFIYLVPQATTMVRNRLFANELATVELPLESFTFYQVDGR